MNTLLAADVALNAFSVVGLLPFVGLLACVAVFPLVPSLHHWWEQNRNKLIVALVLAAVTLSHYALRDTGYHGAAPGGASIIRVLEHALLHEYVPFMALLFSLYVIAGGIVVRGDLRATPRANTAILAIGAVLANVIGTTGASMVLIRPLLSTNRERKHVVHTVVFFIFLVSNIGGCLTPIGDPPLFLGFLRGVPFFWTLRLWKEWAVLCAVLLVIYYYWDRWAYRHEEIRDLFRDVAEVQPIHMVGLLNVLWLVGVVAAVVMLDPSKPVPGTDWRPFPLLRELVQLGFAALSLIVTRREWRAENKFNYVAIGEVACLFLGIFITMQAPIEMLHALAGGFQQRGLSEPWQFFWMTGVLSSFLDNAPTYVVFFETANHFTNLPEQAIVRLTDGRTIRQDLLVAISCAAVFMGANTYIGNGPNFMVKALAEQAGVRMPTFFGYLAYSGAILIPLFVLMTFVFFR